MKTFCDASICVLPVKPLKNKIYPRSSVLSVNAPLSGARSGLIAGKLSFTARSVAERVDNHYEQIDTVCLV